MTNEIWILGATGRTGRAIAERLQQEASLVLVGRDRRRLEAVAAALRGDHRVVCAPFEGSLAVLQEASPSVVVNTVGPFADTAPRVLAALPRGTHYVDLSNELDAVTSVLDGTDLAVDAGRTVVTGAGFGVFATEAAALLAIEGAPVDALRVDAIASAAGEPGILGAALASSLIDGLRGGGRRVVGGEVVRTRLAERPERFTTPDGRKVATAEAPSAELVAAARASGAGTVVAASVFAPTAAPARLAVRVLARALRPATVRRLAIARLAAVRVRERERPAERSWARARAERADGGTTTAWLRTGDAMAFTADVASTVARRLAAGSVPTGAYTPGALFGLELAADVGAHLVREPGGPGDRAY